MSLVDLSQIDTTPGSGSPLAPLAGMDEKAYARHLRAYSVSLDGGQSFAMVVRWVCSPSSYTPVVRITGPMEHVLRRCLRRHDEEQARMQGNDGVA